MPKYDIHEKDPAHIFTNEEINMMLDRFKNNHAMYYSILTAYCTGLRAADIIYEIQKNKTIKQPIFILVSGFQKSDIEYTIKSKGIEVYTVYKPYNFDELANYIKDIIKERSDGT